MNSHFRNDNVDQRIGEFSDNDRPNIDDVKAHYGIAKTVWSSAFIDREGRLHVVLQGRESKALATRHRKDKIPHNEDEYTEDGIFVHTESSPIMDKVCPCMLTPNKTC